MKNKHLSWAALLAVAFVLTPTASAQSNVDTYDDYYWNDYYYDDLYSDYGWDYDWWDGWEYETPYGEWSYEDTWGDGYWEFDDDWY